MQKVEAASSDGNDGPGPGPLQQTVGTGFGTLEWKDFFGSSLSLTPEAIFDDVTRSSNQALHKSSDEPLKNIVHLIAREDADGNGNGSDISDDEESGVVPGSRVIRSRLPSRVYSAFPVSSAPSGAHLGSPSVVEAGRVTEFGGSHRPGSVHGSTTSSSLSSSSSVAINSTHIGRHRRDIIHRLSTTTMDSSSNDDRKRPLSVSSTSSTSIASSSASSSLSRHHHQRKKMATYMNYSGDCGDEDFTVDCLACAEEERDDEELERRRELQEYEYLSNTGCLSTVAEYTDLPPTALMAAVTEHRAITDAVCVVGVVDNHLDCSSTANRSASGTSVDVSKSYSDGVGIFCQRVSGTDSCGAAVVPSCQPSMDEKLNDSTIDRTCSHGAVSVNRLSTGSGCSETTGATPNGSCDTTVAKNATTLQVTTKDCSPANSSVGVGISMATGSGSAVGSVGGAGVSGSSTGILRQVMSQSQYIHCVLSEIVDTERAYINDLRQIIEGYLNHIRQVAPSLDLSDDDVSALFGNIESLYGFNRALLLTLERSIVDPVQIADCFVRHSDGFVVYSEYCTNYPRSVEVLTKCMKDPDMSALLRRQQLALQHGLPLGSYLLKPVQRILKYHVMLQNLLNNHDVLEPGHVTIEMAVERMVNVGRLINEMKRRHEKTVHVQEIQSRLFGWDGADLTTLGDLILEIFRRINISALLSLMSERDKFRMCGAKAFRHIFMFNKAVLVAKRKADGILIVKAFIMCSNLMLIESIPKEPLAFHIIPFDSPRLQYTVQANNHEQKRQWCQQIKKLILDNYNVIIPEKAKELVMMLGRSSKEDECDERVKKQHEAPEYLERRKSRRKSTGIIPELKLRARNGLRRSEPTGGVLTAREVMLNESSLAEEDEHLRSDSTLDVSSPSIQLVGRGKQPLMTMSMGRLRRATIATGLAESATEVDEDDVIVTKAETANRTANSEDSLRRVTFACRTEVVPADETGTFSVDEELICLERRDCCNSTPIEEQKENSLETQCEADDPWQLRKTVRSTMKPKPSTIRVSLHSKTCPTCGHPDGIDRDLVTRTSLSHSAVLGGSINCASRSLVSCTLPNTGKKDSHCPHCIQMSTGDLLQTSTPKEGHCVDVDVAELVELPIRSSSLYDQYSNLAFDKALSLSSLERHNHGVGGAARSDAVAATDFRDTRVNYRRRWRPRHSSLDQLSIEQIPDCRPRRNSFCSDALPDASHTSAAGGVEDGDVSSEAGSSTSELFRRNSADGGLIGVLRGAVVHVASAIKDRSVSGTAAAPCRSLLMSTSSSSVDSDLTVSSANSSTSATVACCSPARARCRLGAVGDFRFGLVGGCHDRRHHHRQRNHQRQSRLTGFIARQQRRVDFIRTGAGVRDDRVTPEGGGLSAVDAVRRGLTNLLRTNSPDEHTGNSVVGQRMAISHRGARLLADNIVTVSKATTTDVLGPETMSTSQSAVVVMENDSHRSGNSVCSKGTMPSGQHETWLDAALESLDTSAADHRREVEQCVKYDGDIVYERCESRTSTTAVANDEIPTVDDLPDDVGGPVGGNSSSSFYETILFNALDGELISSSESAASSTDDLRRATDRDHHPACGQIRGCCHHRRGVIEVDCNHGNDGDDDYELDQSSRSSSISLTTIDENDLLQSLRDRFWQPSLPNRRHQADDITAVSASSSSSSVRRMARCYEGAAVDAGKSTPEVVGGRVPRSPISYRRSTVNRELAECARLTSIRQSVTSVLSRSIDIDLPRNVSAN